MTVNPFPSMKARELLAVLSRSPLSYTVARRKGSHRTLVADGRPTLRFAYHEGATCAPGVVKKILTEGAGLTEDEALDLL